MQLFLLLLKIIILLHLNTNIYFKGNLISNLIVQIKIKHKVCHVSNVSKMEQIYLHIQISI